MKEIVEELGPVQEEYEEVVSCITNETQVLEDIAIWLEVIEQKKVELDEWAATIKSRIDSSEEARDIDIDILVSVSVFTYLITRNAY